MDYPYQNDFCLETLLLFFASLFFFFLQCFSQQHKWNTINVWGKDRDGNLMSKPGTIQILSTSLDTTNYVLGKNLVVCFQGGFTCNSGCTGCLRLTDVKIFLANWRVHALIRGGSKLPQVQTKEPTISMTVGNHVRTTRIIAGDWAACKCKHPQSPERRRLPPGSQMNHLPRTFVNATVLFESTPLSFLLLSSFWADQDTWQVILSSFFCPKHTLITTTAATSVQTTSLYSCAKRQKNAVPQKSY